MILNELERENMKNIEKWHILITIALNFIHVNFASGHGVLTKHYL